MAELQRQWWASDVADNPDDVLYRVDVINKLYIIRSKPVLLYGNDRQARVIT